MDDDDDLLRLQKSLLGVTIRLPWKRLRVRAANRELSD
jgi:hypothetical protein